VAVAAETQTPAVETPPETPPETPSLQGDEIREIQVKLRSFGFNPGPVDGVAGRMTERAAQRYQQERGRQQTGTVDRELLEQLRQDPTPPPMRTTERPPPRRYPPMNQTAVARRNDPLQPLKDGLDGVGRWIDSIVR
jgi:peptidoglycan hydrolase-like protein with peptidoglycan-binding domain